MNGYERAFPIKSLWEESGGISVRGRKWRVPQKVKIVNFMQVRGEMQVAAKQAGFGFKMNFGCFLLWLSRVWLNKIDNVGIRSEFRNKVETPNRSKDNHARCQRGKLLAFYEVQLAF